MNQNISAVTQFWLLTGDAPTGPFDVCQIHAKLATGEVTWETRACAVGDSTWLPLLRVPGFGPQPAVSAPPEHTPAAPPRNGCDTDYPSADRPRGARPAPAPSDFQPHEARALQLRAMLLQDMNNVVLRKQYLAARTPELRRMDEGTPTPESTPASEAGQAKLGAIFGAVAGAVGGAILAAIGGAIAEVVGERTRIARLITGIASFARGLGMVGTAILGSIIGAVAGAIYAPKEARQQAESQRQRRRLCADLGPLPDDAPCDLVAARRRFL